MGQFCSVESPNINIFNPILADLRPLTTKPSPFSGYAAGAHKYQNRRNILQVMFYAFKNIFISPCKKMANIKQGGYSQGRQIYQDGMNFYYNIYGLILYSRKCFYSLNCWFCPEHYLALLPF